MSIRKTDIDGKFLLLLFDIIYISIIVLHTFKLICQYFLFTLKIHGTVN